MKFFFTSSFIFMFLILSELSGITDEKFTDMMLSVDSLIQIECEIRPLSQCKAHRHNGEYRNIQDHDNNSNMCLDNGNTLNWCGYTAITNDSDSDIGSVTGVGGNWTIPKLSPTNSNSYCSICVGMDGVSNEDLELIGTSHKWINGKQENCAWFDMKPGQFCEIVGFPIEVHDLFGATVKYKHPQIFELTLMNYTQGVYTIVPTKHTKSYKAKRSSAAWIVEAPCHAQNVLPLSHFSPITFTGCLAGINDTIGSIKNHHWKHEAINMKCANGILKAYPSKLCDDGHSFEISWKHE